MNIRWTTLLLALIVMPLALAGSNINTTGSVDAAQYYENGASTLSVSVTGNAATASDLVCTDCIGMVEIGDIYLSNTGDTATGNYTFGTSILHIDSTGNRVGIGTTSVSERLTINGNISIVGHGLIAGFSEGGVLQGLGLRAAGSGNRSVLRVLPYGSVASAPAALEVFGTDYIADSGNYERLSIRSKGSSDGRYVVFTDAAGTGAIRQLQVTTGTNTGIVIDTDGDVGIGTAEPSGALHVNSTAPNGSMKVENGTSTHVLINGTTGYVGIGTASPDTFLNIEANGGTGDGRNFLRINNTDTSPSSSANIQISSGATSNSTLLTHLAPSYGLVPGRQDFGLFLSNGPGIIISAPNSAGVIRFITGGANSERVRLDSDGRLGIGTTAPQQQLEVNTTLRLTPTDAPGACSGTTKGSLYYDESLSELCDCNGSSWEQVDGGGAC